MARLRTIGVADGPLRIRPVDAALTAVIIGAVELNVVVGGGYGAASLSAKAYLLGAVLALPVLVRARWPLPVLFACSALLMLFYTFDRRNISPAPLLCLPLYDAAVAGYLAWAIAVPAVIMATGLAVVGASTHESPVTLVSNFLPSVVILMLAVMLGEVVRGRRALAAETASRLRLAGEEREAEAARRVAEERLRIARELHDVVAHTMATINVQAGAATHVLRERPDAAAEALQAIRESSKEGLRELRAILNVLRRADEADPTQPAPGVAQLGALIDGACRAGLPVMLSVTGRQRPLHAAVDLAAYRIVQEALTNAIKHAGPATAAVELSYHDTELRIEVTNTGRGSRAAGHEGSPAGHEGSPAGHERRAAAAGAHDEGTGHGLAGMRERAASVGGTVEAGPLGPSPADGYRVTARLPLAGQELPGGAAPARPGSPARYGDHAQAASPAPPGSPAEDQGSDPALPVSPAPPVSHGQAADPVPPVSHGQAADPVRAADPARTANGALP